MKIRHPSWFPKLVGACDIEICVFVKILKKQKILASEGFQAVTLLLFLG